MSTRRRELFPKHLPSQKDVEPKEVDAEEKSRRWIAGLKQRLDEQAVRRMNRNEPAPEPRFVPEPPIVRRLS